MDLVPFPLRVTSPPPSPARLVAAVIKITKGHSDDFTDGNFLTGRRYSGRVRSMLKLTDLSDKNVQNGSFISNLGMQKSFDVRLTNCAATVEAQLGEKKANSFNYFV